MDRAIKFKAWDTKAKVMYPPGTINLFLDLMGCVVCSYEGKIQEVKNMNLLQFTGLTDKRGIEIYEGDVVKGIAFDGFSVSDGVIKFPDCSYTVEFKDKNARGFYYLHHIRLETLEVLGNIYENPELLEESR